MLGDTYDLFLHRLRFTQNRKAPVFPHTDETSSSLMRKWSDVTLSSSWISSINAFCTTGTSRELSATTALPHSHCHVPENESLQFPYSCCRQRAEDYSPPSLVRQMAGITRWNYLHKLLIRVTLSSATTWHPGPPLFFLNMPALSQKSWGNGRGKKRVLK